ncbi:MAG: LysE family transporter, partial [Pseudomonadota bacterium]|nr:LysE family transporter [Pseudomonadota bacterium]
MAFWTVLPGPGLALVVSRALGAGRRAGFAVITGLVLAVVVFLGIAFVGLLAIAAAMGPMFLVVKYVGAAYLIWRGYRLVVAKDSVVDVETARRFVARSRPGPLGDPQKSESHPVLRRAHADIDRYDG